MLTVGNPSVLPAHIGNVPLPATTTQGVSIPLVALPMLPLVNNVPSSTGADTLSSVRTADSNGVTVARTKNDSGCGSSTGFHADNASGSSRSTPSPDLSQNKLFVGGLGWQTTADKLREHFSQYGEVLDVQILKDPVTQRSRGFGFITFSDPSCVERVLQIPSHTVDGKKVDPKHATPKGRAKAAAAATQSSKTKKVFVGGVSQDTTVEEIKAYFSHFGRVEEAVMLMDQQTKRHRGFGFVTFESEDVVDRICDIHYHTIKAKKVECKRAQPKEVILQTTAAALAAAKKGALINLPVGLNPAVSPMPPLISTLAAQQYAAAAQAQAQAVAAASGYGKLLAGLPALANYRYSPYSLPTAAPTTPQAAAVTPSSAAAQYQGYSLTNVDMSGFQGVDWNALYGMGMYV